MSLLPGGTVPPGDLYISYAQGFGGKFNRLINQLINKLVNQSNTGWGIVDDLVLLTPNVKLPSDCLSYFVLLL